MRAACRTGPASLLAAGNNCRRIGEALPRKQSCHSRIEEYALIGDCETAALVSRDGSIDWLCFPRFDSAACFAALLGTPEHGRWLLTPTDTIQTIRRRYREGTLVLETKYQTDRGVVAVIDCMPLRTTSHDVVRMVEGRRGQVHMRMELVIRFDYGLDPLSWLLRSAKWLAGIGDEHTTGVIYLHADVDVLLVRIAARARPYEQQIVRSYLRALADTYKRFFATYTEASVLAWDMTGRDLLHNADDRSAVLAEIQSAFAGHRS
jgi:hypothetical protein